MSEQAKSTRQGAGGRYAIFGEIAAGGMATVHVGRLVGPRGFQRTVAIKRLHAHYAKDPDFVSMFLDEARMAARVRHPNVVPTLDVIADGEQLLLVMEYVAGESLSRLSRALRVRGEAIAPDIACAIVAGVLHGLHAAHEARNDFGEPLDIVHRDVSPQNILVGTDGIARVVDFGVAKAVGRLQETRDSAVKGKAAYMAPEQIRGLPVDRRSDVFAATVVLWESLTGKRLFVGDNDAATMQNVLGLTIPAPSSLVPSLPAALDEVTRKGLEREPSRRYATARDMALAIERAVPLALPSRVGEWVERVAPAALAERAERLAEVESSSAQSPKAGQIVSSSEFIADALWGGGPAAAKPSPSRAPPPPETDDDAPTHLMPPKTGAAPAASRPAPAAGREGTGAVRWARAGAGLVRKVGIAALAALALVGMLALVLPGYVRDQAVAAAATQGLTLTVDAVHVGLGGVRLLGITAASAELPGVTATAAEMHVETSWLSPKAVIMRGAELSIDGPVAVVARAADRWYHAHHPQLAGAREAQNGDWVKVVVPNVRLTWLHAVAGDGRIDAPDLAGEIAPRSSPRLGDEYHFATPRLTVTTSSGVLGPWRLDLDREVGTDRTRIAFDPPVPDGPNALLIRSSGTTTFDLTLPQSAPARIGIPATLAAVIPTNPSQLGAKVHFSRDPTDHAEATFAFTLVGAHVAKAPGPVDVKLSGSVAGRLGEPLDLKDGALSAAPVRAVVTGPVTLSEGGVQADLAWKATPVPCAQLVPASARKATDDLNKQLAALQGKLGDMGDLGDLGDVSGSLKDMGIDMGALGQSAGAVHFTGTLTASGTITVDSTDLGRNGFTSVAKNNCGLGLFAK